MLFKAYYLDVKNSVHTLDRFEVRFERDEEAIQHSKDLAANFRRRHVPNQPGLTIAVLNQARRKIHEEVVYPKAEQPDPIARSIQLGRPNTEQ